MSERQAKKKRKEQVTEQVTAKKRTKAEILTNSIIAVVIVAILGLGVWAVYNEYNPAAPVVNTEDTVIPEDGAPVDDASQGDVADVPAEEVEAEPDAVADETAETADTEEEVSAE